MRSEPTPLVLSVLLPATLLVTGTAIAGPAAVQATPAPRDLAGTWSCSLSHVRVSGICPPTPKQSGTCEIRKADGAYTLVYASGFRCSPKAACTFSCSVSEGKLTCDNAGAADNEGGRYATELVFDLGAGTPALGTGKSTYQGPGMRCEWKTRLTLTRAAKDAAR
jgi:hypothetical protein